MPRKKEPPKPIEDDSPVISVRAPIDIRNELRSIAETKDRPYTRVAFWLMLRGLEDFRRDGVLVPDDAAPSTSSPRFTSIEEAKADGREVNEELKRMLSAFDGALELRESGTGDEIEMLMLGEVQAGPGGLVPFEFAEKIQVSQYWQRKGARYVLRARGNSMIDAGILDGFVVYVKPIENGERIQNGRTVIALVNGNAMVKEYENVRGRIRLISKNELFGHKPVEIRETDELLIQGIVVGTSGDL